MISRYENENCPVCGQKGTYVKRLSGLILRDCAICRHRYGHYPKDHFINDKIIY